MPEFSDKSKARLATCDPRLQAVFNRVIQNFDCTILCGYRGQKEQDEAYAKGYSKLKYPNGKHNKTPSMAVDAMPCPVVWPDEAPAGQERLMAYKRAYLFAGYVLGTAKQMGIELRWGGDWNRNLDLRDENGLSDVPHYELRV